MFFCSQMGGPAWALPAPPECRLAHQVHDLLQPGKVVLALLRLTQTPGEFADADHVDAYGLHQLDITFPRGLGILFRASIRINPLLGVIIDAEIHKLRLSLVLVFRVPSKLTLRNKPPFRNGFLFASCSQAGRGVKWQVARAAGRADAGLARWTLLLDRLALLDVEGALGTFQAGVIEVEPIEDLIVIVARGGGRAVGEFLEWVPSTTGWGSPRRESGGCGDCRRCSSRVTGF
jgi:hypothetical protein